MEPSMIQERLNRGRIYSRFSPFALNEMLILKTLAAVEEKSLQTPGLLTYEIESKRIYPFNVARRICLDIAKKLPMPNLQKLVLRISKEIILAPSGLEASYETFLRGEKGF